MSSRVATLLLGCALFAAIPADGGEKTGGRKISLLASTFPIHQILRNVASGAAGAQVDILIPASLGCPHDYALAAPEMRKLEAADVLVINGLGMEEFLDARLARLNPGLTVIDGSAGIDCLLPDGDEADDDADEEDARAEEGEDGHSHRGGINPHVFVSPALSAKLAANIAAALCKIDPGNAERYQANAERYRSAMARLAGEIEDLGGRLANKRMVQPHGVFDYLARDLGIEIVGTLQPHGGDLSAAGMLELLERIRRSKPGALFSEPRRQDKAAQTLSRETGIGLFVLDPGDSGPDDAPLDYFEALTRKNLAVIAAALGER